MRRIVVGVDGSEPSMHALEYAAGLAEDLGGELIVVFARYEYLAMPPHVAEAMFADVLDRVEAHIREATAKLLADRAVQWQVVVREGEPASVLRDVAREMGATMIVAGRRGWSNVTELLLGSVSNRLAHHSECPVVLVHDG